MAEPLEQNQPVRESPSARETLQRALSDWQRRRSEWAVIFQGALAVQNFERLALAESKIDECQREISRMEGLLGKRDADD